MSEPSPTRIRFQEPELPAPAQIEAYFERSRAARWFSNGGPCHGLLVERLSERVGGAHAVPVANATLGLLLALRAMAGEPGARRLVAMPSFTFVAGPDVVRWAGFEPLFVDVEEDSWHLDPRELDGALSAHGDRVAAVLAASSFGTPPPAALRAEWERACRDAGVPLLVDSAAGFGAEADDGSPLGTQGDAEVFSFHATKPFAVGEGGLVTTRDAALAERVARLANFGLAAGRADVDVPGLNAKLGEVQCATALAVLDRHDEVLRARRERADAMRAALEPAGARFQLGCERATWQFVPVVVGEQARGAILGAAEAAGVELRTYYEPLHGFAAFRDHPRHGELPVTGELGRRILSLPMANRLTGEARERVVGLITAHLETPARTTA